MKDKKKEDSLDRVDRKFVRHIKFSDRQKKCRKNYDTVKLVSRRFVTISDGANYET